MSLQLAQSGGLTNLQKSVTSVGQKAYGTQQAPDAVVLAGSIIQTVLGLLGVIFLGLIVYGGYLWLMARGNEQQIEKAKETIKAGIIGLIIMLGAYAISNIVISRLSNATLGAY